MTGTLAKQTLSGLALFAVSLLGLDCRADAPATKKANRLAAESSPYLLQHAHNPVNWYPWGSEAFQAAREQGKLIFLSIGYSSCHWCHVMERESFESDDVAKLLNQWFISIKVDREERPDIDAIYMLALNIQGERGGWPLSMFCTAEGKPIVGGTYWPPEDRTVQGETTRGFKSVLNFMHRWQTEKPQLLKEQSERLAEATNSALRAVGRGKAIVNLDHDLVRAAVDGIKEEFDPKFGGFGSAAHDFRGTKFPQPSYLQLLLEQGGPGSDSILQVTLDHMARGGIYDQLGGGFHRYSTERTWTVPHFEKMLYDNAQLVEIYSQAYAQSKNAEYRRVVEETLAFVDRELSAPEGGSYSALDADSEGNEGQFYVWTAKQIEQTLKTPGAAGLFKTEYGIDKNPNFEDKAYILTLPLPLAERAAALKMPEKELHQQLEQARAALLAARGRRAKPFLDTKILTSWNGQMIAAYALAGRLLAKPEYVAHSARAATFILQQLRTPDGRLLHSFNAGSAKAPKSRSNAFLDDYAFLVHGLIALYDATSEKHWLDEAGKLADTMIRLYADGENGGFFYTSNDHEKLFARSKDQYDSAQPSGNSIAARDLVELASRTGNKGYREVATKSFTAFAGTLKSNPTAMPALAGALAIYLADGAKAEANQQFVGELLAQADGPSKSESVIKLQAKAEPAKPGADGKQEVSLTINIDEGWHLYANPVGQDDLSSVATTLEVSAAEKPKDVKVTYPTGKLVVDPVVGKYSVYDGKIILKAAVYRAAGDTSPLELTLKFQACSERQCLLPATKKIRVP